MDATWWPSPARTALHLSPTNGSFNVLLQIHGKHQWPATPPIGRLSVPGCVCLRCGGEIFDLQSFQPVWRHSGPPSSLSCLRYTSVCHPLEQLPELLLAALAQGTQPTVAADTPVLPHSSSLLKCVPYTYTQLVILPVAWLNLPQVSATCFSAISGSYTY